MRLSCDFVISQVSAALILMATVNQCIVLTKRLATSVRPLHATDGKVVIEVRRRRTVM